MKKSTARITMLASLLTASYTTAVTTYSAAEHHSLVDACWWGFMTFTTVGYGDQYPTSMAGRISGIVLVVTAVFVVLPTMTAIIASKLIVDEDAWTHDEQEEVKDLLRKIAKKLEA